MLLTNKVAIVTGAASVRGLGFATAKLFAENGAKVVIIDLNKEASEAAAKSLGDDHLGLAAAWRTKRRSVLQWNKLWRNMAGLMCWLIMPVLHSLLN